MQSMLSKVRSTKKPRPPRIVIYGTKGIGKSTFGSQAPNPVFIQCESGLDEIDAVSFPVSRSIASVEKAIQDLLVGNHDYKTLVIDTIDRMERLIWRQVCADNDKVHIEDFNYGKGYKIAEDVWCRILDKLDELRAKRNMAIILIAHSKIKRYNDPTTEPYDRYQPDLHDTACSLIYGWADIIGFATYRITVNNERIDFPKSVRSRIKGSNDRVIYFHERPSYVAKTRYKLPEEVELGWNSFSASLFKTHDYRSVYHA